MAGRLSILVFFLLAATAHAVALQHFNCGPEQSPVEVKDVTLDPDPAVSGQDMTFTIPATTGVDITGGTVIVIVQYRGIPVHIERDALCGKTNKCPIAAGEDFIFTNSQPLPSVTPAGAYTVRINVLDDDKKVLFCQRLQFQIEKPAAEQAHSLVGRIAGAVKSLFVGSREEVGEVIDAAEQAWKLSADQKVALRNAMAAADSLGWNHLLSEGYEERRAE